MIFYYKISNFFAYFTIKPYYHRDLNPRATKLNDTVFSNDIKHSLVHFMIFDILNQNAWTDTDNKVMLICNR
jgi:predicted SprT family Zn-dependent metalloprotease